MTNRFIAALKRIEHGAVKVAEVAAVVAVPVVSHGMISSDAIQGALTLALGKGDSMNTLEQMGIMMILAALQSVVKNPAHKAVMEAQMLSVADDIYEAYGIVPPVRTQPSV